MKVSNENNSKELSYELHQQLLKKIGKVITDFAKSNADVFPQDSKEMSFIMLTATKVTFLNMLIFLIKEEKHEEEIDGLKETLKIILDSRNLN